jgi:hypothetical protein
MPTVKALDKISSKWARVCQSSQSAYEDGVRNPRGDWAENTAKAAQAYASGVQAAVSSGRFQKGVANAGTSKWQANAIAKGPGRWAEGVRLAQDAYERGFAPYRTVLEGLTLPARGPVGDPGNINRVKVVAEALHKERLRRTGG